jgi:hypothetical protein
VKEPFYAYNEHMQRSTVFPEEYIDVLLEDAKREQLVATRRSLSSRAATQAKRKKITLAGDKR